jgi:hypothetical protein
MADRKETFVLWTLPARETWEDLDGHLATLIGTLVFGIHERNMSHRKSQSIVLL